jgi:hypothetical protein
MHCGLLLLPRCSCPPLASPHPLSTYADFWALVATGRVPVPILVTYVAVCVRVCWSCHCLGGTDVVDIPVSSFLLKSISICLTLSQTLLVIWAIVILMLSWLRSTK